MFDKKIVVKNAIKNKHWFDNQRISLCMQLNIISITFLQLKKVSKKSGFLPKLASLY